MIEWTLAILTQSVCLEEKEVLGNSSLDPLLEIENIEDIEYSYGTDPKKDSPNVAYLPSVRFPKPLPPTLPAYS